MTYEIRTATTGDLKDIVRLHLNRLPDYLFAKLGKSVLRHIYSLELKDAESQIYVAEEDGSIIGFISGTKSSKGLSNKAKKSPSIVLSTFLRLVTHPTLSKNVFDYLKYPAKKPDRPEILAIVVDEGHQGKGVGAALLDRLVEGFREKACDSVFVLCGEGLAAANSLYKKRGFVQSSKLELAGTLMNIYGLKIRPVESTEKPKRLLFLISDIPYTHHVLAPFLHSGHECRFYKTGALHGLNVFKQILRHLKKGAPLFSFYWFLHLTRVMCRNYPQGKVKIDGIVHDVNSPEFLKIISDYNPDIIISVNFDQWIGPKVSDRYETWNLHPALLPNYRGRFPFFWALYNREKKIGATLHKVSKEWDKGDILMQKEVPILKGDNLDRLFARSCIAGGELLKEAVEKGPGMLKPVPQKGKGSYYSCPNDLQFLKYLFS